MSEDRYVKGDLRAASCAFFMCDVQERFGPVIQAFEAVVENAKRLVALSKLLSIPLVVTEQYPKGLGRTLTEIDVGHGHLFEKTKFSMMIPEVAQFLDERVGIKQVVLFGLETHVCVQQTVIDLLKRGLEVFLVADASSSRSKTDRQMALLRARDAGAVVTTTESVLFQLIADKNHEQFKAVQGLVKTLPPDSGLLD